MRLFGYLMCVVLGSASTMVIAQAVPVGPDLGPTVSERYPLAASVNYTAMMSNSPPGLCGCFLMSGGSGDAVFHAWRSVAAVAQLAGNRSGQVPDSIQGLSMVTYMAGPRASFGILRRVTGYGQFLGGRAHGFDSYFPVNNPKATGAGGSWAIAPGAGVEVGVGSWLSVRVVQVEYLMTWLPNAANTDQHSLRVSGGIVFRMSRARLTR